MSPPASTEPNGPEFVNHSGSAMMLHYLSIGVVTGVLLVVGYWLYRRRQSHVAESKHIPITGRKLTRETAMSRRKQNRTTEQQPPSAAAEPAPNLENEPVQGVKHAPANVPSRDVDAEGKTIGYEVADTNARGVAIAAVALVIFIGIGLFAVAGLVDRFESTRPRPTPVTLVNPSDTPQPPNLWIAPVADMANFQAQEADTLTSYGWVDEENGVARIPITQAMQLLIAQPLPARDQAPPDLFQALPPYQLESSGGKEAE